MAKRHPDRDLLRRFAEGRGSNSERRRIAAHLSHCSTCRGRIQVLPTGSQDLEEMELDRGERKRAAAEADYDSIIRGAYDTLLKRDADLRRERAGAPGLLAQLLEQPPERQRMLLGNSNRFRSWALVELLLEASSESWFTDPRRSEELAELALEVAELLPRGFYSLPLVADLKARCHSYLANARRLRSDLAGAESAFQEADLLLREGTADPLERARYYHWLGVLHFDRRRFTEAMRLLDRAIPAYRRCHDEHHAGQAMFSKANALHFLGDTDGAIQTLQDAIELIDPQREPLYRFIAQHNLVIYLIEADRFMEARALLQECGEDYQRFGSAANLRRYHWAQGKIALGLGQLGKASASLREAQEGFISQGIALDAALVSLDLAMVLLRQGRTSELKVLAGDTLEIFKALEIEREALAAYTLFHQAAEAETVTLATLKEIAQTIQSVQKQP